MGEQGESDQNMATNPNPRSRLGSSRTFVSGVGTECQEDPGDLRFGGNLLLEPRREMDVEVS